MAYIVATQTGFPEHYYPQSVLATALKKYFLAMDLEFDLETIDRFFTNVKINGRYFTFPLDSFYDPPGVAEVANAAITRCLNVVENTVTDLLDKAAIAPQDISQLTATTLIAATPGLDARLINRIPFAPDIKRMSLTGVGCMGGAFGLARVADYLKGHPDESSVLFAMEPSSALWQGSLQRDLTRMIEQLPQQPQVYSDIIMTIVTAALFGDGSAAVLMVGEDHPQAQPGQPRIVDSRSIILPNTVHLMGMDLVDTGTRNILRPEVADYVRVALHKTIDPLLEAHNLSTDDIACWMVHPGGPKIIQAVQEEFHLDQELLQGSWDALAEIGNISSPTVLYILEQGLAGKQPSAGAYGLLLAMGPGFSQEAVLLQW